CALERFQNYTGREKFLRERIAPQQLIVGEYQPACDILEARRGLEDFSTLGLAEQRADVVGRKIERVDVGKPPGLVLSIRIGKRFEFLPGRLLLIAEPFRELGRARLEISRQNRARSRRRF